MARNQSALRNRIEYFGLLTAYVLLARLPLPVSILIADAAAFLWRTVDRRHRRRVVEQSMQSLGIDRDAAEELAKRNYRHYAYVLLEILRLARIDPETVMRHVDLGVTAAMFNGALAAGKGMVLATGHLGNWEWGCMGLGRVGRVEGVIARPLDNPLIDAFLNRARLKAGVEVWYKTGAIRKAMGALKHNRGFAAVIDQDGGYNGVMAPFLGREASTMSLPVELAMRNGAPVAVGALMRDGRPMRFKAVVKRLHWPRPDADKEAELRRLLVEVNADLSAIIAEYPEQWIWILNRWKSSRVRDRASVNA